MSCSIWLSRCALPPPAREMDMLLTSGERISNSLVAMAIHSLGAEARSFSGSQAGVITTGSHGNAKIIDVTPGRVRTALDEARSFWSPDSKASARTARTSRRSDAVARTPLPWRWQLHSTPTSARSTPTSTAFSPPIRASSPDAHRLETVSFEEMLELAACGAKVLMLRCVEYARRYNVPVHVRSSYTTKPGTIVSGSMEDIPVEEALITGVAHDRGEAKITVVGLPDTPGHAAKVFRAVSDAEINIDMVLQNISKVETNKTDITFTLPTADGPPRAVEILTKRQEDIGFTQILFDDHIGKVSLVGAGMRSHPGVTATFCEALAKADINIDLISTSEIRISVLVKDTELDDAVRVIHDAFGLGGEEEAVVHAGTGR